MALSPNSLVLALDMGTSSSRAALFDASGQRVADTTAQLSYPLLTGADGAAELEPGALLHAISQCIEQTLSLARSNAAVRDRPIAGIGVTCFWHSLIGTDAAGKPLTRILTWADSRGRDAAGELRTRVSEKTVHARTGCMVRTSFWPAKLGWLRSASPRLFRRVERWMSPAEWVQLQLAGDASCALGMATGTGLFDPSRLTWDPAMLKECSVQTKSLNPLSDLPAATVGPLADRCPELRNVPWFPGIGDGAASNLGSGATRPGLAAINVGTSAALRIMREGARARAPFGLFCYRVDAARYLVGGAVSNAGNLRAWCLKELRLPDDLAIEADLAARPGPNHGLTVLPFWTAERAPTWNEDLRGCILGMTQHTTAMDVLQAITEATYHRIAQIADAVVASEPATPKFLISGGIQHSTTAMQRFADVLGQPVYANPEPEASLRGAAIFALEKLGATIAPLRAGRAFRPRARVAALYREERQRQSELEAVMLRASRKA